MMLVCVLASCWFTNVSHVSGTLSKKDKKDKKNNEQARSVRAKCLFLLSNYLQLLEKIVWSVDKLRKSAKVWVWFT